VRLRAEYMRGGTSKGVFLRTEDLPPPGPARDAVLLRLVGSPDPYGKQIDGMGGATSSTSKVVLLSHSQRQGFDVDYLFGQVSIDRPVVDWSGNCGNLSAAVGPCAIRGGLVNVPPDGTATVRIWQANLGKEILAHVPMSNGEVLEDGTFWLDGVAFPAAKILLEFIDPVGGRGVFPTGKPVEILETSYGKYRATLIDAGNPTAFVAAESLGLTATELQEPLNSDAGKLDRCESLRCAAAVCMGIASDTEEARTRKLHTPKLAFVSRPRDYVTSSGVAISAGQFDVAARIISMGKLHHAMTGTGVIALAVAAALPGTIVRELLPDARVARDDSPLRFGHPSGIVDARATTHLEKSGWVVDKVALSRSARRLMDGFVYVPDSSRVGERGAR
jgi:probable AcnD-accessory protein PrpF